MLSCQNVLQSLVDTRSISKIKDDPPYIACEQSSVRGFILYSYIYFILNKRRKDQFWLKDKVLYKNIGK